jgi:hypothetical protein
MPSGFKEIAGIHAGELSVAFVSSGNAMDAENRMKQMGQMEQ